jgi:hypothetical protein
MVALAASVSFLAAITEPGKTLAIATAEAPRRKFLLEIELSFISVFHLLVRLLMQIYQLIFKISKKAVDYWGWLSKNGYICRK